VEFETSEAAQKMMNALNNTPIPHTNSIFKLNWASGGGLNDKRAPEYSVFVGDLGHDVDNDLLHVRVYPRVTHLTKATFSQLYSSIKSAKVVMDPNTGHSRGYGFVRFLSEIEQQRSLTEMQGQFCGSRPMRISLATPKHAAQTVGYFGVFNDPTNTTVFVGGVGNDLTEDELQAYVF
jgi:RNA recognition motif-containing protein